MGTAELDYRSIKDVVSWTWSQVWRTVEFNGSTNALNRIYEFSWGLSEPSAGCGN